MKRKTKIVKNSIRCKKCGEVLVSKHVHDFVPCKCFRESGGLEGVACDGGTDYLRRLGNVNDYEDLSETRPYTDEERDEFNRNQLKLAEAYDGLFEYELME